MARRARVPAVVNGRRQRVVGARIEVRTRQTKKKPARPLSRAQLAKLLASKYYIGKVTFGGVEYRGRHKRLIDTDTFDRAQQVLSAHQNAGEKDRKHHHYLKATLFCGHC